jgi:hypothetical protein
VKGHKLNCKIYFSSMSCITSVHLEVGQCFAVWRIFIEGALHAVEISFASTQSEARHLRSSVDRESEAVEERKMETRTKSAGRSRNAKELTCDDLGR